MDLTVYIKSYLANRNKTWVRVISWLLVFLLLLWWNRSLYRVTIFHQSNIFFNFFAFLQTIGFYYTFRFLLYPNFKRSNYLLFVLGIVICYFFSCIIVLVPLHLVMHLKWFPENAAIVRFYEYFSLKSVSSLLSKFTLLWYITTVLWCNIFTIVIFLAVQIYRSHEDRLIALQARDAMELSFLRSQMQPHFLFNTLNNIYGLLIECDRESALLLKLSDFMRYSLYQGSEEFVPLFDEIRFIRTYLELEFLRLNRKGIITSSILPKKSDENLVISPLLLLHFLESLISSLLQVNSLEKLSIQLKNSDNSLMIITTYHLKSTENIPRFSIDSSEDWKRRLELHYDKKYHLDSSFLTGAGTVSLSLYLRTRSSISP